MSGWCPLYLSIIPQRLSVRYGFDEIVPDARERSFRPTIVLSFGLRHELLTVLSDIDSSVLLVGSGTFYTWPYAQVTPTLFVFGVVHSFVSELSVNFISLLNSILSSRSDTTIMIPLSDPRIITNDKTTQLWWAHPALLSSSPLSPSPPTDPW